MKSKFNTIAGLLVYLIHIFLMVLFTVSGLIVDLKWVVVIYILVSLHLVIFRGCGITRLQHHMNWLDDDREFIDDILWKITKKEFSEDTINKLGWFLFTLPLIVALVYQW